jgi:hypothetical protein
MFFPRVLIYPNIIIQGQYVYIVVVGCIIDHCCLVFDKGEVRVVVVGYIVYQYCLIFDCGVINLCCF